MALSIPSAPGPVREGPTLFGQVVAGAVGGLLDEAAELAGEADALIAVLAEPKQHECIGKRLCASDALGKGQRAKLDISVAGVRNLTLTGHYVAGSKWLFAYTSISSPLLAPARMMLAIASRPCSCGSCPQKPCSALAGRGGAAGLPWMVPNPKAQLA